MDSYLWTWGARWGAACVLVVVWAATSVVAGVRGRWVSALVFAALGLTTAAALSTHLVPLLVGADLPRDAWALDVARGAPFVAIAGLAALGRPRPGRVAFDLWSVVPAVLWSHGAPAWVFSVVLIGRGWLAPGQRRRLLIGGVLLLGVAVLAEGWRAELRGLAQDQGVGTDPAVRMVSAVTSGFELAGWGVVTRWVVTESRR